MPAVCQLVSLPQNVLHRIPMYPYREMKDRQVPGVVDHIEHVTLIMLSRCFSRQQVATHRIMSRCGERVPDCS
jgi:hypothetical protein